MALGLIPKTHDNIPTLIKAPIKINIPIGGIIVPNSSIVTKHKYRIVNILIWVPILFPTKRIHTNPTGFIPEFIMLVIDAFIESA